MLAVSAHIEMHGAKALSTLNSQYSIAMIWMQAHTNRQHSNSYYTAACIQNISGLSPLSSLPFENVSDNNNSRWSDSNTTIMMA